MFERFTERARQVVVLAQDEARALKHNYIGTEHLLLGLLREDEGLASRVLSTLGLSANGVRIRIKQLVPEGDIEVGGQIPFTPRAKKVHELALREALSLGHNYIGTEHLLLGLVRENGWFAAQIMGELDADAEKVRNEIIRMLSGPRSSMNGLRWNREDVELGQLYSAKGRVFRVIGICDEPTVTLEALDDGMRDSWVISSPLFAEFERLTPSQAGAA